MIARFLRGPLPIIAAAAVLTILIGAFAASRLRYDVPSQATEVEHVAVTHAIHAGVPQPKLMVRAPQAKPEMSAAGSNASASVSNENHAPQPQITREGTVSLLVGNVNDAVASITRLVHQEHGDVFSLQLDNQGQTNATDSAQLVVRIPAEQFDGSLSAMDRFGKVRSSSITAEDLSGDITDSSARLRNLLRTESDIRKIMDRSGTVSEVLEAENQLSSVREQIEQLVSELKTMHQQVAYSKLSIDIEPEVASTVVEPAAKAQLTTALHAALAALSQTTVAIVAMLLWALLFSPYALAMVIGGWLIVGFARRRAARLH